jgi:hypothetical protein
MQLSWLGHSPAPALRGLTVHCVGGCGTGSGISYVQHYSMQLLHVKSLYFKSGEVYGRPL